MGGTDEPTNLVELTIEEHAEAHRVLYEKYGNEKDRIAWQGLLGLIPKSDIMRDLHKLGRELGNISLKEKYGVSNPGQLPHCRVATSERNRRLHKEGIISAPDWTGKKHREDTKRLIGAKNSVKQSGSGNSQFGTIWITNGVENKKIKSVDAIPDGWHKGRVTATVVY